MDLSNRPGHIIIRNLVGFLALVAVHFIADVYSIPKRSGFNQISPYLFLLLMYGWIVFHNRILFERLFLRGRKLTYAGWTILAMTICSLNMYFILQQVFHVKYTLPQIVSFWIYTVTGLGIYVIFRYLQLLQKKNVQAVSMPAPSSEQPSTFACTIDGARHQIPCESILYIESLENYIKVVTAKKSHLVRLALKDAEERVPKPGFIRISRSHILNTSHISRVESDVVTIAGQQFRIGKVYKRYVEEQLSRYGQML
jgi:hypothetical protein